jgi:hypothetical protein
MHILIGWSQQSLQANVIFGAESVFYCLAEQERQSIIDNFGWTINDAGATIDCNVPDNTTPVSINQNGSAFTAVPANIQ